MPETKTYTPSQAAIVRELCDTHGLDPEQISFDGDEIVPMFDFEAVSLLSLKLTDIQSIDCWLVGTDVDARSIAKCTVTLPDGRTRSCEDTAFLGEILGNGVIIETRRMADSTAQNRAARRGIRSVGVNLYRAHRKFMETGEVASGDLRYNPRNANYAEIHVLASEIGLIADGDRSAYRNYLAALFPETFDAVLPDEVSSKNLNDIQLHQLLVSLRTMAALSRRASAKAAA